MANTVYHFTPTTVTNGSTPINATWGNDAQTQALDALSGINPDLLTAFILSGVAATKDGVTANQLDIASGRAYVTQTDGTLALIVVASDNTHTTSALSSTYHLYLQPDGTWYWSTSNAPAANSLHICDVTTDGSGNISAVTDQRPLAATLLGGMAGNLTLPPLSGATLKGTLNLNGGGFVDWIGSPTFLQRFHTPESGSAAGQVLFAWNGSAAMQVLGIGSASFFNGNPETALSDTGGFLKLAGQNTAGSYGVPPIVAQALDVHVTATTQQTILSFTPPAGKYRISTYLIIGNAGTFTITFQATVGLGNLFVLPLVSGTTMLFPSGVGIVGADYAGSPIVVSANGTAALTVTYQNATGTPSDFVTVIVERLA